MTSFILHIIAMFTMLLDHMWGTSIISSEVFTCIGRISFPIFAFMIVEGFSHTSDKKKYIKRMFIFALISEIPFNLMVSLRVFNPFHQNVLWTFLIALLLMQWNEKHKNKDDIVKTFFIILGTIVLGGLIGIISCSDYNAGGVLTVLTFYYFKDKTWFNRLIQLIFLYFINFEVLGGIGWDLNLFGNTFFLPQQSIALLSLVPIWLYNGKQGPYNKTTKNIYWWFYPTHMLVLIAIKLIF